MDDEENYTEGQALTDWLSAFDVDDDSKAEERESTIKAYRTQYEANKNAKVGTEIICPVCRKKFIKNSYQQAFCVRKDKKQKHRCKDVYWNSVDDNRRFRAEIFNR